MEKSRNSTFKFEGAHTFFEMLMDKRMQDAKLLDTVDHQMHQTVHKGATTKKSRLQVAATLLLT